MILLLAWVGVVVDEDPRSLMVGDIRVQTGPHAEVADGRLYAICIICGQCDWKSRQAQTGPTPRLPDGSLYAPPYTVETLGVLRLEKSPMCALKALRWGESYVKKPDPARIPSPPAKWNATGRKTVESLCSFSSRLSRIIRGSRTGVSGLGEGWHADRYQ